MAQISEYRSPAYFGRMISTAFPRNSSSRLRPDTTSPSPPALAAGAHSGATITTYIAHPPGPPADPGRTLLIFASCGAGHIARNGRTELAWRTANERAQPGPSRIPWSGRLFSTEPRLFSTEVVLPDLANSLLVGTRTS